MVIGLKRYPVSSSSMNGDSEVHLDGTTNSFTNANAMPKDTSDTPSTAQSDTSEPYDLICVGFGPASLAIAVALHDALSCTASALPAPRVLYLERQTTFKWHGGMLLPDARMQISFLKDLATLRNPLSRFTFLNYLHEVGRLVQFVNLSTFLPLREEYSDYMTWCARHFESDVQYGRETTSIDPVYSTPASFSSGRGGERVENKEKVQMWNVTSRDINTGETSTLAAKHVVIAVGGKPKIPDALTDDSADSAIVHSSSYRTIVPKMLAAHESAEGRKGMRRRRIAVVGGGQSAAEIFNDLTIRYHDVEVRMYTGDSALRPSDDSPLFVFPSPPSSSLPSPLSPSFPLPFHP